VLSATVLGFPAFVILLGVVPTSLDQSNPTQMSRRFLIVIGLMFISGALGGCLYNFRGLMKHSAVGDFAETYALTYYLRPFAGAVSGVMVFFLLLGGAIAFNPTPPVSGTPNWSTHLGLMPYVAFALLAGYGSQEFMFKLKDLAESLFALKKSEK
jgi:hypothetical protein